VTALTAEPILALYQEMDQLLGEAERVCRQHPPSWTDLFARRLIACQGILTRLMTSLDLNEGGQMARNLYRIYDNMDFLIAQATLSYDANGLREVRELLTELLGAVR
jgi:flagellar secretion chaperone FliS